MSPKTSKGMIESLQADGTLHQRGAFKVDEHKARHKLQKFRLADPHRYVLELVQAAVLLNASEIRFRIDTDEMEASFDRFLDEEDLKSLRNALFVSTSESIALRHIAIALMSAQALDLVEMVVESAKGHRKHRITYDMASGQEQFSTDAYSGEHFTRIYVRKRVTSARVLDFFRYIFGSLAEVTYLQEHCKYAHIKVFHGELRCSFGLPELDPEVIRVKTTKEEGRLWLSKNADFSEVEILQNGVLIATQRLPGLPLPFKAVVESSRLTKDLSQSAFVEDDAWKELMSEVLEKARYKAILEGFRGQSSGERKHVETSKVMRALIEWKVDKKPFSPAQKSLERMLAKVPLWPLADNTSGSRFGTYTLVPLNALKQKVIRVSTQRFPRVSLEGPPVLMETHGAEGVPQVGPADREMLGQYLKLPVQDVTDQLAQVARSQKLRSNWEVGSAHDRLSAVEYPVRLDLTHEKFDVQLGLSSLDSSDDGVQWVIGNRLITLDRFNKAPLLGLRVIISGPSKGGEPEYDPELFVEILRRLPSLMSKLASSLDTHPNPKNARRQLVTYLSDLANGDVHQRFLDEIGSNKWQFGRAAEQAAEELASTFLSKYGGADTAWAIRVPASKRGVDLEAIQRISGLGEVYYAPIFPMYGRPGFLSLAQIAEVLADPAASFPSVHKRHKERAEAGGLTGQSDTLLLFNKTKELLFHLFGNRLVDRVRPAKEEPQKREIKDAPKTGLSDPQLLSWIQEMLTELTADEKYLRSDHRITDLYLIKGNPGAALVTREEEGYGINQSHPLVKARPRDIGVLGMLMSGVYTGMNALDPSSSASQELEFQTRISEWLTVQLLAEAGTQH